MSETRFGACHRPSRVRNRSRPVRRPCAASQPVVRENPMIAKYTDHAANERTFLAWIRTGLAVIAFGFFLVKLNVFVDATGGGSPLHPLAENAGAFVAVAARYAGLAMVVTGLAIIGRSSAGFERTRRAIDHDEVIQMP